MATGGDAGAPVATVIQAAVGAPVSVGGSVAMAPPVDELAFGPLLADEPPADTPEWANL